MGDECVPDLRNPTWQRLIQEVGWRPPQPGPGPHGAAEFSLRCCPRQGGRLHPVHISVDWFLNLPDDELSVAEHVAESLEGGRPRCLWLQQSLPELKDLVLRLHRVTPPTWDALEYGQLSLPSWPRDAESSHWSARVRVTASSMATTVATRQWFGSAPAANTRAAWADPRMAPDLAPAGQVVEGGQLAANLLWLHGLHPDLVVAIHNKLGIRGPLPALAYAASALWRHNPRTGRSYPPAPVGWVGATVRESGLAHQAGAATLIAALAVPGDITDPRRLLEWIKDPLAPVDSGWPQLHASGVSVHDVRSWTPPSTAIDDSTWTRWLSRCPPTPGSASPQVPADFLTWVREAALTGAERWVAAYQSEDDRSQWGLAEKEELTCMTRAPDILEGLRSGDPERAADVLADVDAIHTYVGDPKSYRYHLDTCPVSDAARIVTGVQAYKNSAAVAWALLGPNPAGGGRDDAGDQRRRYPSALCLATWIALELRAGRLADATGLDALRDTARMDPPDDPGALMLAILSSSEH